MRNEKSLCRAWHKFSCHPKPDTLDLYWDQFLQSEEYQSIPEAPQEKSYYEGMAAQRKEFAEIPEVKKPEFPTWDETYTATYQRKEFEAGSSFDIYIWLKKWYEGISIPDEPDKWQLLMDDIRKWSDATFERKQANPAIACHLIKEVDELIASLTIGTFNNDTHNNKIVMEYADCMMLLFDSAKHAGFTTSELYSAMVEKLEINKQRKWGEPDENGAVQHIPDEPDLNTEPPALNTEPPNNIGLLTGELANILMQTKSRSVIIVMLKQYADKEWKNGYIEAGSDIRTALNLPKVNDNSLVDDLIHLLMDSETRGYTKANEEWKERSKLYCEIAKASTDQKWKDKIEGFDQKNELDSESQSYWDWLKKELLEDKT